MHPSIRHSRFGLRENLQNQKQRLLGAVDIWFRRFRRLKSTSGSDSLVWGKTLGHSRPHFLFSQKSFYTPTSQGCCEDREEMPKSFVKLQSPLQTGVPSSTTVTCQKKGSKSTGSEDTNCTESIFCLNELLSLQLP